MNVKKNYLLFFFLMSFGWLQGQVSENMVLMSNVDPASEDYNDIWGYVDQATGKEFAIIGSLSAIYFYDVTTPTSPVLINYFTPGSSNIWRDFKTYGHYCYAVMDNADEGLLIFDMKDIADPVDPRVIQIGGLYDPKAFFTEAHNIYIDEEHARLYAVGTDTRSNGMIILDLSTPESPSLLASKSLAINSTTGGYVHDVYVKDHIAYCSHGATKSYVVWDFTNPVSPIFKASLNSSGYNHSSWVTPNGDYAVYAEEVGIGLPLGIVDLSELEDGTINTIHTFKEPLLAPDHVNNRPHNPFILGDYLYVSYYHDGLVVFDISDLVSGTFDPTMTTRRVAYYDTYPSNSAYSGYAGAWGVYPYLPSGNLLVSDDAKGLFVLKMNSVLLPVELSSFDARLEKEEVQLKWTTSAEENSDYFEIERSTDAENFEVIGKVKAAGNASTENNYTAVDQDPEVGTNYYRLKIVDLDGSFEYSDQKSVNYHRVDLQLFPNYIDADQQVKLRINGLQNNDARLSLSDLTGKLLYTMELENIQDGDEINFSLVSNLTNGMYIINLQSDQIKLTEKIIIAR